MDPRHVELQQQQSQTGGQQSDPLEEQVRLPAREQVARSLAQIERLEPELHAFVQLADDVEQVAAARDAQQTRGLLHGVPVAIKDIIDVAGLPTRCGSRLTSPEPVITSAACVRRLEELGAVVVGKSVTTEYAYFNPGPTRNPADPEHTPGGSSSGSAAAVAAGMVPLALGSQTAGSLTRPASYCGVSGMVLAAGSTDISGITGLSHTLDSLGLLTRTVADLELVWRSFTDERRAPVEAPTSVLLWGGSGLHELDPQMQQLLEVVADRLRGVEVTVGELDWDDHVRTLASDHLVVMSAEAVEERSELLDHLEEVSAPLAELLRGGQQVAEDDYRHALFRRERSQLDLAEKLATGTDGGAVILGPAAPGAAPRGLSATGSPVLSRPWQLLGLPVVTVAGARTSSGLPLGVQLVGWPGREPELLRTARLVEDLVRGLRIDPTATPAPTDPENARGEESL